MNKGELCRLQGALYMTDHDGLPLEFDLPFPPSVNCYWRHVVLHRKQTTMLSRAARQYRADAIAALSHVAHRRAYRSGFQVALIRVAVSSASPAPLPGRSVPVRLPKTQRA